MFVDLLNTLAASYDDGVARQVRHSSDSIVEAGDAGAQPHAPSPKILLINGVSPLEG